MQQVQQRIAQIESRRDAGTLTSSAAALLSILPERDALLLDVEHLRHYAGLHAAEDATNAQWLSLDTRANALYAQAQAALAFIEPTILTLDDEELRAALAANADLQLYAHDLDNVRRRRAHVRSAEVEAVLAQAQDTLTSFESTYEAIVDADLTFGTFTDEQGQVVELQQNMQTRYLESADRRVRQEVWTRYYDAYLAKRHLLAANYAGEVKRNVFNARVRAYSSALDATLDDTAMPTAVFHTLLDMFARNIGVWQRYFRVLAHVLQVEQVHGWDICERPIRRSGQVSPTFTFPDGVELALAALAPLGEEYIAIARQGVHERWIDVYPNRGKTGGAFSSGAQGMHPFILLNWSGDLSAVSTLTHELGHSLHSHATWHSQPTVYAWYGDVVSETASNLHQFLLADHVLRTTTDRDVQIELLLERMGYNLRYLFTMPLLAQFEHTCHARIERGEGLTADDMRSTMADLYAEAYGDTVVVDRERMGMHWATMPHLFLPFYPYTYGAGTTAALALGSRILTEGEPAVSRYHHLLRSGASVFEHDALCAAGVDLTQPEPWQAAFDLLSTYIDRLEELTR